MGITRTAGVREDRIQVDRITPAGDIQEEDIRAVAIPVAGTPAGEGISPFA